MKVVEKFGRILLPLITPFKEDSSVDYETARKAAKFVVEKGYCDSLIISGTTGEFHSLTFEERVKLFEEIKDEIGDSVPLIAGTGTISTKETVELTKEAERIGYDAAMVVVPYYCHPTQEGIYQHFKEVAKNTSLPVMIYNIPLFVNENISPGTVAKLSEIENIVAVKEEAGINPLQAMEFIKKTDGKITVYSGDDLMVLQVMTQGGVGVVSGGAHIAGDIEKEMINAFLEGNNDLAVEKFHILYDLFTAFHGVNRNRVNPTPLVKAAFEMISGLPTSNVRPPLTPANDVEKDLLKQALKKIGKLS